MDDDSIEVPDFSGDDFANDKEIQKLRKEAQAYRQLIEDSVAIVKSELGLEESSHKNFKGFLMFRNLTAIVLDSYKSTRFSFKLIVSTAEYTSSYPVSRYANTGSDKYFFGYMELLKNYPATYICKESIREKIVNLFVKSDTDFADNKKFSRRFDVVTQDGYRLADLLRFKNLDELTAFPEMEVEIHGNTCLFRNSRRPISLEEATQFSALAKMLSNILN